MTTSLVYDGDCGFCTSAARWVGRLRLSVGRVIPWQQADLGALGLTQQQCETKLQWVGDDGHVSSGHEALAQVLLQSARPWRAVGRVLLTPPVSGLASRFYDLIAANRARLPGGSPACALPESQRPQAS